MFLEAFSISAKTPRDGKVEISRAAHERLTKIGPEFRVLAPAGSGTARLSSMTCSCAKRAGERHVHHFVESELFKQLTPGASAAIDLDEATMALHLNLV